MNQFLLMHKDDPVARLSVEINEDNEDVLHVSKVFKGRLLPNGVKNAGWNNIDECLTIWHDNRCTPSHRPNHNLIMDKLGVNSSPDLLFHSHLCSLTDCYWFKPQNSDVTWDDVNFYNNGFTSNLSTHLFYNDTNIPINNLNSPDITTDGALPKTWERNKDGKFVLVKSSMGKFPMDAYYEIIASKILDELKFDHVQYWLEKRNGIDCSICECFIKSDDEEFIPTQNVLLGRQCTASEFIPTLRENGFGDDIDKMFLFDFIIGNIDRHARNYGLIIDSESQRVKRLAPLFDHGTCDMINDIGFMTYTPAREPFEKYINGVSSDILSLVHQIDINHIEDVVNNLPFMDATKDKILKQLKIRISKIIKII